MHTIRKNLPTITRIALGSALTIFGLNGFLGFLPQPPHPGPDGDFLGALAATGYMFPLIKGTELTAGLLLLSNRFVPLALALFAPVLVNIFAFHLFLDPKGVGMTAALLSAEIFLAWRYRHVFASMLAVRANPQTPAVSSIQVPAHVRA